MKLNYRETVILGIVLAFVIIIAGFFAFIKPKNQTIKDNKEILATKREERDQVQDKIDMIEPLKKQITETCDNIDKLSEPFVAVNDIDTPEKLDQYMQPFAEENKVKIMSLNVSALTETPINYYFKKPTIAGVSLMDEADMDGGLSTEAAKKLAESESLSQRAVSTILASQYGVSVRGKKEDVWNFMKAIEEQTETITINSVGISDYSFEGSYDAAGNFQPKADGESDVQFVITVYSVFDYVRPNVEAE